MDFDSLPDDAAQPQATQPAPQAPAGQQNVPGMSFDDMQDDSQTAPQQPQTSTLGALARGVAKGVLTSPLETAIETNVLHHRKSDILQSEQQHPIATGIGEAAGLLGGAFTGTGEAALLESAGNLGAKAAGLAQPISTAAKIGSSAVKQAIEMSILQGGDETAKMMINDPNASADSAIANVGMAAALGAGTGALLTGVISPLWKATLGPKMTEMLNATKNVLNRETAVLPEQLASDLKALNVEPSPIQTADLSEDPRASRYMNDLTRAEHPEILAAKTDLQKRVADSVMEPLGTNLDEMKNYDIADSGKSTVDAIKEKINNTFKPLWEGMDKRNAEAALINIPDEEKLALRDKILEKGFTETAGNSEYMNQYNKLADQVLEQDTLGGFDKMDTQLRKASKNFAQDSNLSDVQRNVRQMIKDFKEEQITKAAMASEKAGITGAKQAGKDLIAERANLNKQYAQAESVREQLGDHFNINSGSARDFMRQLDSELTPEQVVKKFSIKNNTEGAAFLQQHFPEAFQEVVKNEQKNLLKPAIMSAAKKGEVPIDVNKLNDIIAKTKSGKASYLNTILPQQFIDRAEAAGRILNATNKVKDSGTPAGLWGVLRGAATSAMGMAGVATGHGFGSSLIMSELATRLGKSVPEALKLSYLKYLGSTEPISAEGFKAMTDYFDIVQKSAKVLNMSTKAVLKPGAQVAAMPALKLVAARDKLDKQVDKFTENPQQLMASSTSPIGHYLPEHQQALSQASARNIQYLQSLKPRPKQNSPLDTPVQPSTTDMARYNRALDISNDPTIVLQSVKDGSVKVNDLKDLQAMYPGWYQQAAQKLSNEMTNAQHNGVQIPYRTKQGMSLFLGQPLSSGMTPNNIQAAQVSLMPSQQPQQGAQQPNGKQSKGAVSKLGKNNSMYKTPTQSAEQDRGDRE